MIPLHQNALHKMTKTHNTRSAEDGTDGRHNDVYLSSGHSRVRLMINKAGTLDVEDTDLAHNKEPRSRSVPPPLSRGSSIIAFEERPSVRELLERPSIDELRQSFSSLHELFENNAKSITEETCTAFKVQHVPRGLPQRDMAAKLKDSGFAGSFDFLYAPARLRSGLTNGYFFINFRSPSAAERFQQRFNAVPWADSTAPLTITPADAQGFEANVQQVLHSHAVANGPPEFSPLVFDTDGREIPFPRSEHKRQKPTKRTKRANTT